jgi:hypothetical protein
MKVAQMQEQNRKSKENLRPKDESPLLSGFPYFLYFIKPTTGGQRINRRVAALAMRYEVGTTGRVRHSCHERVAALFYVQSGGVLASQ